MGDRPARPGHCPAEGTLRMQSGHWATFGPIDPFTLIQLPRTRGSVVKRGIGLVTDVRRNLIHPL